MKKKTMITIAGIVLLCILAIYIHISITNGPADENIEKYAEQISRLNAVEGLHVDQLRETWVDGELRYEENVQLYVNGYTYARLTDEKDYVIDTKNTLKEIQKSQDILYSFYVDEAGEVMTSAMQGMLWTPIKMTLLNEKYLFLDYNNISYEETADYYIVTYDNRGMVGSRVGGAYPESEFKFSKSISYFDKEWTLIKIETIETFDVEKDGLSEEYTRKTYIVFYDETGDEIDKKIEEEFSFIESYF